MAQGMTGFGSAEKDGFKVEVRSLNHRYIDVSVRMPSVLMEHEMPVRNIIKGTFARGKFDVVVLQTDKRQYNIRMNKELARGLYDAFLDLQKELSLPGSLSIDFFSKYRELLLTEKPELTKESLYDALKDAILRVEEMRKNEGEALKKEMMNRLEKLNVHHGEMEGLSKEIVHSHKEILSKRIAELTFNLSIDDARLAQEVAIVAQRGDISEELARLKSHYQQFYSFLSKEDVIGRRLDFLLQEINREVNTIASKASDIRIINITIDIKTEIEKMREQVQNIQ